MKKRILTLFVAGLALFGITGCSSLSSYDKGNAAGFAAVLAFDSIEDEAKMVAIQEDIADFLRSDRDVTDTLIEQYSYDIARKLDKNPAVVRIVMAKLRAELNLESGDARALEFIQGVYDALSYVYPDERGTIPPE